MQTKNFHQKPEKTQNKSRYHDAETIKMKKKHNINTFSMHFNQSKFKVVLVDLYTTTSSHCILQPGPNALYFVVFHVCSAVLNILYTDAFFICL